MQEQHCVNAIVNIGST